jgi:hypothetical protein
MSAGNTFIPSRGSKKIQFSSYAGKLEGQTFEVVLTCSRDEPPVVGETANVVDLVYNREQPMIDSKPIAPLSTTATSEDPPRSGIPICSLSTRWAPLRHLFRFLRAHFRRRSACVQHDTKKQSDLFHTDNCSDTPTSKNLRLVL